MDTIRDALPPSLRDNPFFDFSVEKDFAPAFDRIKLDHVMPAFDYALALMEKNVAAIADNKARPGFKNTIEALEQSGELVSYFIGVFFNMMPGTGPDEERYDAILQEIMQKYDAARRIYSENQKLHERVLAIKTSPSYQNLSAEKKYLHEMYANTFAEHGIALEPQKRETIRVMSERIAALELKSQNNMKMAERTSLLIVDDQRRLAGLPAFSLAAAAQKAAAAGQPGKWAFGLDKDTYISFLQSVEDRGLRRELWRAYNTQASSGPYDNRATILELIKMQQKRAQLLGYRNVATMNLTYNMAVETGKVSRFLSGLRRAAMPVAKKETEALAAYALQQGGIALEQWDVPYYQERMKKDLLGFTEEELRPYFEMENVLQGAFRHFNKLFGIRFEESHDHPVYHEDVRVFNVCKARSGEKMGVLYMDLYARDGKPPGVAWEAGILSQGLFQGKVRRPVNMIVTKFTKGTGGEPTLLTHYDVQTLFHEMGHATHDLLSKCRYPSLSGTNVAGDFIEFPSQIQENWTFQPEVLDDFARHYKTGAKLPDATKEKLQESARFMAGTEVLNKTMRGWLDLSWYRADPEKITTVEAFETRALKAYRLLPPHESLLSPSFSHLFGGGYEANYYSYQWSQVMEADAFNAFRDKGLYDPQVAAAYRKIPERGGSVEPSKLFREFRHRAHDQKSFLERNGLLGESFNYAAALKPANDNAATAPAQAPRRARRPAPSP